MLGEFYHGFACVFVSSSSHLVLMKLAIFTLHEYKVMIYFVFLWGWTFLHLFIYMVFLGWVLFPIQFTRAFLSIHQEPGHVQRLFKAAQASLPTQRRGGSGRFSKWEKDTAGNGGRLATRGRAPDRTLISHAPQSMNPSRLQLWWIDQVTPRGQCNCMIYYLPWCGQRQEEKQGLRNALECGGPS